MPTSQDVFLFDNKVRNIGTVSQMVMYKGFQGHVDPPMSLKALATHIFKVGNPQDSLVAYLFRLDDNQPTWIPYNKNFKSLPVSASAIDSNPIGNAVIFHFNLPVDLESPNICIVIYRTGPRDDSNFYRIYQDFLQIQ